MAARSAAARSALARSAAAAAMDELARWVMRFLGDNLCARADVVVDGDDDDGWCGEYAHGEAMARDRARGSRSRRRRRGARGTRRRAMGANADDGRARAAMLGASVRAYLANGAMRETVRCARRWGVVRRARP